MNKFCFFSACFLCILTTIYAEAPVNKCCIEKERALSSLEMAEILLTKARASYPPCKEDENSKGDSSKKKPWNYIETIKKLISDVKRSLPICSNPEKEKEEREKKEKEEREKKEKEEREKKEKEDREKKEKEEREKKEKEEREKKEKEEKERKEKEEKEKKEKEEKEKKEKEERDMKEKEEKDRKEKEEREKKEKEEKEKKDKEERDKKEAKYKDCSEILASGSTESGVYNILSEKPFTTGKTLEVFCDMETDNGGWTVIQRRGKFPVQQDFYLDWESYKKGFGNIKQEFWMGNENIRVLCDKGCQLRFDMQDAKGEKGYARYRSFSLTDSNYRLSINGYDGNIGDDMLEHDKFDFSTKDQGETERARKFKGGWWYRSSGYYCNLNGKYQPGSSNLETVHWYAWRENQNLASVEMKVKPK